MTSWSKLNRTELHQACARLGYRLPPNSDRKVYEKILDGHEVNLDTTTMDKWRDAIMSFVNAHWKDLQTQIDCPARSKDPKACYGCIDTQVIACLVSNKDVFKHISRRKV